jgi:outer membrane protein OmpA-like peptidoglycan-associated protein
VTLSPRVKNGKVTGKVLDNAGKPVAATLHFSGPQNLDVKTDDGGAFSTPLPGGSYVVRVEADKYFGKELKLDVSDGQEQDASVTMRQKPTVSHVTVKDGKLNVRAGMSFKGSGPTLDVAQPSALILDELADVLLAHPEIKKVRIEAHWDTSLPQDKAQELTQQQAKAIAAYLTKQGVPAERIEVVGSGSTKPIVPNIGMAKLRNRRVEFRAVN